MERKFKLLVFDWDGTLMDSEARIVSCVHAAARDMAIEAPSEDRVRDIIGLGLKEALDKLFPGSDDPFKERFIEFYRHYFLHEDSTPSLLSRRSGGAEWIGRGGLSVGRCHGKGAAWPG